MMDLNKIADKNYMVCSVCNIIIRKKNRARHITTPRHVLAEELINRRTGHIMSIEEAIKLINENKKQKPNNNLVILR